MTKPISITIASDVDRDLLMAELSYGDQDWAYMYEKDGELILEAYPRQDGKPWIFNVGVLVDGIQRARDKLGR